MDPLNVAVVERRRSGGRCDSASVNAVVTETYRVSESILLRQERLRDLVEVASFEERSDLPADIMEVVQQQKVDLIQFIKSLERN